MKNCLRVLVALLCLVRLSSAQDESVLARSFIFEVKQGMAPQFESAVKDHIQWLGEHGETWEWSAYQIVTGRGLGTYVFVTGGHTWGDFDENAEFRRKAAIHWGENVATFVENAESKIYMLEESLSRFEGMSDSVRILMVTDFNLKPLADQAFVDRFGTLTEAIRSQNDAPPVLAMRLVSGGKPQIKFVHLLEKWEDAGRKDKAVQAALESLGSDAQELAEDLRGMTEDIETAVLRSRPELSFKPSESRVAGQ